MTLTYLQLFTNMTRRLEAYKNTSGDVVTKHPVPDRWRASLIVRTREHEIGRLEAIRLGDSNWQPDDVEEKVQHDQTTGDTEDPFVVSWVEVVHADTDEQHDLSYGPLNSTKLDVGDISGVVDTEDSKLR